ncbi:MAG: SPFH domain-containing protein, partial [Clostridia bacterium]|nr:SPFH domain-containing protein [Clostridia bacterium]
TMALLKLIEWKSEDRNCLVHRINLAKDYIQRGSKLTVREGQAAVFCHKGKMADVFLPGMYTLDTGNVPFLTKLMGWKYGFESPFKSDIYFVNTNQIAGEKWGTKNPIIIRDADYGAVRVRAFGTFAYKVEDPYVFLTEITGAVSTFYSNEINEYLRSMAITRISDIVGESKVPVLDMAGNLVEFGEEVKKQLAESFKAIGLTVTQFNFENFSMPEALEKALDESASLGILGKNMHVYTQKAQADALINASKNPGTAGGVMGAGIGMSMGMGMGNMFMNNMNNMNQNMQGAVTVPCPSCGAQMSASAKFCPECGASRTKKCPACGAIIKSPNAKFCSECGSTLSEQKSSACPKCGKPTKPGAKFCPECGEKL